MGDKKDYNVGRGKPPQDKQFTKGKSGNLSGRPKGSKNFKTDFLEEAQELVKITVDGDVRTCTRQRAAIKRLWISAMSGDSKSMIQVTDLMMKYEGEGEIGDAELNPGDRELMNRHLEKHIKNLKPTNTKDSNDDK